MTERNVSNVILPLTRFISPDPVVQSGHRRLQILAGSIVSTGGKPQTIDLCVNAESKNELVDLIILTARRGVREDRSRLSNSSFNISPQFKLNRR